MPQSVIIDVKEPMGTALSALSVLVIEDVEDAGEVICIRAKTRGRDPAKSFMSSEVA